MIPKCGNAKDIYAVDALVSSAEWAKGSQKKLGFEALIETAPGLAHVQEIAAASPRLQSLHLGAADFAASMGMQTTGIGGTQEGYYMLPPEEAEGARAPQYPDPWHMATVAIVAACRTNGLLPVDGPFGDFSDTDGFIAQARRVATLGMVGKWAIHPGQVALTNEIFTPSEAKVSEARDILAAMREAEARGQGAATYKGRLIDIASVRQAQVIVKMAELIAG
jgi:malyl-CoA/(S)-citramalyl-CoA lyase